MDASGTNRTTIMTDKTAGTIENLEQNYHGDSKNCWFRLETWNRTTMMTDRTAGNLGNLESYFIKLHAESQATQCMPHTHTHTQTHTMLVCIIKLMWPVAIQHVCFDVPEPRRVYVCEECVHVKSVCMWVGDNVGHFGSQMNVWEHAHTHRHTHTTVNLTITLSPMPVERGWTSLAGECFSWKWVYHHHHCFSPSRRHRRGSDEAETTLTITIPLPSNPGLNAKC